MRNTLTDLNNHLFAELERLGDEEVVGEALDGELKRASAISNVAQQIIQLGALAVKAEKVQYETASNPLALLTGGSK